MLTNAHNLRDRTTEVTFGDGRSVQGELVAVDPDGDLAVLAVDTAEVAAITWATAVATPGAVVFAVGRTAAGGTRLSFGLVSGIERSFRGPRGRQITGSLEHTAPLVRGSSGQSARRRARSRRRPQHGPPRRRLLPRAARRRRPAHPGRRPEPRRVAAAPRARGGPGPDGGALPSCGHRSASPTRPVCSCVPSRRTAPPPAAGVQVGDLLTAAGGIELGTVDDLHRALDGARATGTLALDRRPRHGGAGR